ncbi:MAG: Zn-dependent hydrolase [Anaerolineae bacterium]|nr:MAG: amidase, hydantoinase/carbamoylase family [Chloroflexi bacterium OLB13]MBC6957916.1 Zn-dependent hydrolase [Chloroflexota bacterium]MBV6437990.1 putative hydrolase [Anaerolineae bacterium]MDL1916980.1 Zn-dependent hydrolase [Anaerolineae bacterium CFX4]OQY80990.1 MAG: Zn-dependent hydrolase [Anaerolineae bacterium UTCFX5]
MLNPQRTLDELKDLRRLTGDDNGAQRVAFTETWAKARAWLRAKLEQLPVEIENDEAGNLWATLRGESDKEVLMGGHIDSVPNGGWLDGCLNTVAALEVLRNIASEGKPPVTVRLVDWTDEEGARFGRSLFGSSAASGTMIPDELRALKDKDGILLTDAIAKYGISLDNILDAHKQLKNAKAYLELHIEQGPVLLDRDEALGVVIGTFGVERHSFRFTGQAAHSGSTPMNRRRDALAAAAKLALVIRDIANRHGGVCTCGRVDTRPGIVTSVVAECDITLDQRHMDADALAAMWREARESAQRFAEEEKCEVTWSKLWDIHPIPFHPQLLDFCEEAVREVTGTAHRLPSGPLHDAAEVARAGVPTVMMFTQSLHGISHNKIEDTKEEHILMSVQAFDKLAHRTMAWVAAQ